MTGSIDDFEGEYPWRDEQLLRKLYEVEELTTREIADLFDCHRSTVEKWMGRYGIELRHHGPQGSEPAYTDPDTLERLYHGERLNIYQIAERLDCSSSVVHNWLKKHGIETRAAGEATHAHQLRQPASFQTVPRGYERWRNHHDGEYFYVYVHRLLAVAEHGFGEVCGKVVHHKNGIKWDNRPDNLVLMTDSEHTALHARNRPEESEGGYV